MIIGIAGNKGGTGKTTTTVTLAELLAFVGKKVLVVDNDDSANSSLALGAYIEDTEEVLNGLEQPVRVNIAELYKYRYETAETVERTICKTHIPGVDIIPASERHKRTTNEIIIASLLNNKNSNVILKKALKTIKDRYDFILIDNGPADNVLLTNCLFAADMIITPALSEKVSEKGAIGTFKRIVGLIDEYDLDIEFKGVFFTRVESNTLAFKDAREDYRKDFGDKLLNTYVRKDTTVNTVLSKFHSVLENCTSSNFVFDYVHLLLELGILDSQSESILKRAIGEE